MKLIAQIIISTTAKEQTTKIGEGWKTLIKINGFVAGDVLNFKFVNKLESNVIKVIKV
jgi:hypothetical protein